MTQGGSNQSSQTTTHLWVRRAYSGHVVFLCSMPSDQASWSLGTCTEVDVSMLRARERAQRSTRQGGQMLVRGPWWTKAGAAGRTLARHGDVFLYLGVCMGDVREKVGRRLDEGKARQARWVLLGALTIPRTCLFAAHCRTFCALREVKTGLRRRPKRLRILAQTQERKREVPQADRCTEGPPRADTTTTFTRAHQAHLGWMAHFASG